MSQQKQLCSHEIFKKVEIEQVKGKVLLSNIKKVMAVVNQTMEEVQETKQAMGAFLGEKPPQPAMGNLPNPGDAANLDQLSEQDLSVYQRLYTNYYLNIKKPKTAQSQSSILGQTQNPRPPIYAGNYNNISNINSVLSFNPNMLPKETRNTRFQSETSLNSRNNQNNNNSSGILMPSQITNKVVKQQNFMTENEPKKNQKSLKVGSNKSKSKSRGTHRNSLRIPQIQNHGRSSLIENQSSYSINILPTATNDKENNYLDMLQEKENEHMLSSSTSRKSHRSSLIQLNQDFQTQRHMQQQQNQLNFKVQLPSSNLIQGQKKRRSLILPTNKKEIPLNNNNNYAFNVDLNQSHNNSYYFASSSKHQKNAQNPNKHNSEYFPIEDPVTNKENDKEVVLISKGGAVNALERKFRERDNKIAVKRRSASRKKNIPTSWMFIDQKNTIPKVPVQKLR